MRIVVRKGAVPVGAVLAVAGILGAVIIRFLHFDRIPVTLCTFRAVTGMPCMSCGSTRALARLAAFDPMAALRIQPLFTVVMLGVVAFGIADLVVFVARRSVLSIHFTKSSFKWSAAVAGVLILANWAYLLLSAARS